MKNKIYKIQNNKKKKKFFLEYKKLRIELKKKATDTLRLQKKLIKKNQQFQQQQQQHQTMNLNVNSLNELRYKYENSLKEVNDYYTLLEETEKQHLRLVMIEERNHFCTFFKLIKPIIVRNHNFRTHARTR